jgi:hypothetical protein
MAFPFNEKSNRNVMRLEDEQSLLVWLLHSYAQHPLIVQLVLHRADEDDNSPPPYGQKQYLDL